MQAQKLCVEEYLKLWGQEWVTARIGSFIEDTYFSGINMFFGIAQDDSFKHETPITYEEFSKVTFGGTGTFKQQHYTQFKVNLDTGELEILEHY